MHRKNMDTAWSIYTARITLKNHYYLLQIGHMISQCMEAWEKIWKKVKQSLEQKHRRLLECMKETPLEEHKDEMERKIQIRFI